MTKNKYLGFLCSIVGKSQDYGRLLEELHKIPFYHIIPNDDNRAMDGAELRDAFLDEVGPSGAPFLPEYPCSVLEMMIAMAKRLEFETAQSKWEKSPDEWFWILVDNLGFTSCDNTAFIQCQTIGDYVRKSVRIFLERSYDSDGNGGLFPLKNPQKDQRRVEIWYQMNAYVLENYPI